MSPYKFIVNGSFYLLLSTSLLAWPMFGEDSVKTGSEDPAVLTRTAIDSPSSGQARMDLTDGSIQETTGSNTEEITAAPDCNNEIRAAVPTSSVPSTLKEKIEGSILNVTASMELIRAKVKEIEEGGRSDVVECYRKMVKKQEEAAALYMQALQAEVVGKTAQGVILNRAGFATRLSADAELKAIEAEENGKTDVAERYRKIVKKQEEAAAFYMQALQAEVAGKTARGTYVNHAGAATQSMAEVELKVIEAEGNQKSQIAERYRKVVKKQEEAVALFMQALQVDGLGKAIQGAILNSAGAATNLSAEAEFKAIEAEENGKADVAERYREIARKAEGTAVLHMQALQAEVIRKTDEKNYSNRVTVATNLSVKAEFKAIEAEENGKAELAGLYRRVVKKQEEAAALYMQALQAEMIRKTDQGVILSNAAFATRLSGNTEFKAIEAEENGKTDVAERYRRVVKKQEEAAALYMQALQAEVVRKTDQGIILHSAGSATKLSADLELKAIEVEEMGRLESARSYMAVSKIYQEAATIAFSGSLLNNESMRQKIKAEADARQKKADGMLKKIQGTLL